MGSFSIWHWAIAATVLMLVLAGRLRWSSGGHTAAEALSVVPVPRGTTDTQSHAEALRDDLALRLQKHCAERHLACTSFQSIAGAEAVWLRLEFVQHAADVQLSLRSTLIVTVDRRDFHRFENLLTVRVARGTQRREVNDLISLNDSDIAELLNFAAGQRGPLPVLRSPRIRQHLWQIWRPKNKVQRLRRDWQLTTLRTVGLLALLIASMTVLPQWAAIANCPSDDTCDFQNLALASLAALLAAACFLADTLLARSRRVHVLNLGRPRSDPLSLQRLDSWQATVNHLGANRNGVRAAILARLSAALPAGVTIKLETIGYASVDGKVEREQLVARFRRAMAFVHLEAYADDLYVAWDSHVNAGIWMEQEAARGVDRQTGLHVVANRVVAGWQRPSEYDLNDASFLTEWVHANISAVIQQKLAEFKIDQDIDFTVQRESRSSALKAERDEPTGKAARRFGMAALKRSG